MGSGSQGSTDTVSSILNQQVAGDYNPPHKSVLVLHRREFDETDPALDVSDIRVGTPAVDFSSRRPCLAAEQRWSVVFSPFHVRRSWVLFSPFAPVDFIFRRRFPA